MSNEIKTNEIQILAYHLWEEAGKPEGRDEEFWEKAQKQVLDKEYKEYQKEEFTPLKPVMKNPIVANPKK